MKIKIGVSGDVGSFSEEAALIYSQREGFQPDIHYAIDMEGVLLGLDKGKFDLGIFPVVNSRGGLVRQAFDAMGKHLFEVTDELWMEVHQCLMKISNMDNKNIKNITSHPQAIFQCERYLKKEWGDKKLIDYEDTAKAARDLSLGIIKSDTAVIAPARCAQIYNLEVIAKGIQDNHPNLTTFIIVKK